MKTKLVRPGPVGKSCLTCRRRRKKCDQTRPACERCRKGKFECLGYDCLDSDKTSDSPSSDDISFVDLGQIQDVWTTQGNSASTNVAVTTIGPPNSTLFTPDPFSKSGITLPTSLFQIHTPSLQPLFSPRFDDETPQDSLAPRKAGKQRRTLSNAATSPPDALYQLNARTMTLLLKMSPDVSWVPSDVLDMTNYFMSRFERLISMSFFKPAYKQVLQIRNTVNWRLQNFSTTRWAMFTCTKLFDSILRGEPTSAAETIALRRSMNQIERLLLSSTPQNPTAAETQNQLTGLLELAFFKLRTDQIDTYELLRNYAPTFLQIVYSDPAFWPSLHSSTAVSLAHVLVSTSYEISHFSMLDMLCSMAYGLPQAVEYDTSTAPFGEGVHPAEIVHGCPPALQLLLVDLNTLSSWKRIGPILNWGIIEKKLKEWQPVVQTSAGEDSWRAVARLAIQESWRHTLLIYLYMAVCGVTSDDPRVESSVRQVYQTINTVKYELQPVANANLFMQFLVAGAFTSNERYRSLTREKLVDGVAPRFWLLNVNSFVPVLDHLWHGAAANGQPIRWSDYVHSRQTCIPVSTWFSCVNC